MARPSAQPLVVALGSNLGNRLGNLCLAVHELEKSGIRVGPVSSVFETPPAGFLDQPPFLNMVALASTHLPPRRVLSIFQSVEEHAGRSRAFPNSPRTLDLDLLFFSDWIVRDAGLSVPHPRWKGRSFVVRPLEEVLPRHRDPETGWTVQEVARFWPIEPKEIQMVASPMAFARALKEWKE